MIIINPDGTVSTLDNVEYNQDGSIHRVHIDLDKNSEAYFNQATVQSSKARSKKTKQHKTTQPKGKNVPKSNAPAPQPVVKKEEPQEPVRVKAHTKDPNFSIFHFKREIDKLLQRKKESKNVYEHEYSPYVVMSIDDELKMYFIRRCCELGIRINGKYNPDNSTKTKDDRKTSAPSPKKDKPKQTSQDRTFQTTHGNSIGELASISGDITQFTQSFQKGKKPLYGYARDIFGHVQERDVFDEERKSDFNQRQSRQSRYDYSDYDSNDDNDGAYEDWK